jgi:hypothetical protein
MRAFAKKRGFIALLLFLSFTCPLPSLSQERSRTANAPIELTSGNLSEYLSRLRANDGNPSDYVVKEPLRLSGPQDEWRVNNLTFELSGEISLESTNLTIDVKGVISSTNRDKVIFRSFPNDERDAKRGSNGGTGVSGSTSGEPASHGGTGGRGGDGEPGTSGRDSGDLTLRLRTVPKPGFSVSLVGQNGGSGGAGGPGGAGGRGQKGRPGSSGVLNCNRGGDNGGGGGAGGDGGNGGAGGGCGSGGRLTVIAPSAIVQQVQDHIIVDTTSAHAGTPGDPGPAGPGGPGGDGGDGSGFCSGGTHGPNGPPGRSGTSLPVNQTSCKAPTILFVPVD